MDQLALLFILMLGALVTVPLAGRIGLPAPILMTIFGIGLALLPFIPAVDIPPDYILPLVLPPLLYAAARRTSWRQFTTHWRPILLLAVLLVMVTTAAVAAVAHAVIPGLPLAAAVALAALVAPPDPIAASAVASSLGLPRRIMAILEGEGLFNDVTAIVIYRLAVTAAVTGAFSWPSAIGQFLLSAAVAITVGVVLGWAAGKLSDLLADTNLRVGLTLLVPFAAYALAEQLHGSGVLATITAAFVLQEFNADADDIEGRLTGAAFWDIVDTLVTGVAFGLIGLEMHNLFHSWSGKLGELLATGALVTTVLIAVRLLWLLPAAWLARKTTTPDTDSEIPATWRETIVMWWSGMRGVATVALALAVPLHTEDGTPFPARDDILFVAFTVVIATLVLQGITLPWVVRTLGVKADSQAERRLEKHLATVAAHAARRRLKAIDTEQDLPEDVSETLHRQLAAFETKISPRPMETEIRQATNRRIRHLALLRDTQADILSAARGAVLEQRTAPGTAPEVVDRVLRQIDIRSLR
ncbi:sodium/proton antiporter, CPA1 family (TC 2.A.36) [Stackebrandtia albiflava]|uniref:Sodium/proton antiporter, CPA1 family (TC 2.A.36) n=1 Tax=Stackebrandtia albiflava TaxID=406432 RepID=A0A562VDE7_9ACTN|nr:Na+/H+ antiporter [Stackebrandtia albiflava]TWJ15885.1 sodium/proton antiporter, CPA1 family (TC 2.A.36) [Stackebrandtia albiflava]